MEEQLISFETAKLAKEKCFDIHCRFHYDKENGNLYENEDFPYNSWNGSLFAPTQSLLQKWLREEHKLIVSINIMSDLSYYSLLINIDEDKLNLSNQSQNRGFITYEEALEDGLFEALKLIK